MIIITLGDIVGITLLALALFFIGAVYVFEYIKNKWRKK